MYVGQNFEIEYHAGEKSAGDPINGIAVIPGNLNASQINTELIKIVARKFRDDQGKIFTPTDKATLWGGVTDVSTIPSL
jgi:hypothetical protein